MDTISTDQIVHTLAAVINERDEAISTIEQQEQTIKELREALSIAIEEADSWYDDSTGHGVLRSLNRYRHLTKGDK